jgi:hypothetical protein
MGVGEDAIDKQSRVEPGCVEADCCRYLRCVIRMLLKKHDYRAY